MTKLSAAKREKWPKVTHSIVAVVAVLLKANVFSSVSLQMAFGEGVLSLINGLTTSVLRGLTFSGIRLHISYEFKDSWA